MLRLRGRLLSIQVLIVLLSAGVYGQSADSGVGFAVASIKPILPASEGHMRLDYCRPDGSFVVAGAPLLWSLKYAFDEPEYAIAGGPHWINDFDSAYDIEAKPEGASDKEQCRSMLRVLFRERFHLVTHHEMRLASVLFLRPSQKGPKLKPGGGVHWNGSVQLNGDGTTEWPNGLTMAQFARILSGNIERPVIDQTGLAGIYGITLDYSRSDDDGKPDILTAVQEQLGLKLSSGKAPIDMFVIDHIQKPDPN